MNARSEYDFSEAEAMRKFARLQAFDVSVAVGDKTLLHPASTYFAAGQVTAILGPNGAGKSTLMSVLTGQRKPGQGRVDINGQSLQTCAHADLARLRAFVAQETQVAFDFSVQEVVAIGRMPHGHLRDAQNAAHVEAVLHELKLAAFARRPFTTLSGGERQRVQFARALAQIAGREQESLLILDEPTAALDLAQQTVVLGLARRRAALGTCVLAVVHDLNLAARYADRVLVMKGGRLHADGSVAETYRTAALSDAFGVDVDVEHAACDGAPMVIARRMPFGGSAPEGQGSLQDVNGSS